MGNKIVDKINHLNPVYQNMVIGSLMGVFIAYILSRIYNIWGGEDWAWAIFLLIGPLIGFLSGQERQRMQRMKKEKASLERNILEVQKALKKSNTKYRIMLENLSDGVFLTTEEGEFVLFNSAMSLITGYSESELKMKTVNDLRINRQETSQKEDALIDNGICRYSERWRTKYDEERELDICARYLKISGNQLILHTARSSGPEQHHGKKEERIQKLVDMYRAKWIEAFQVSQHVFKQLYLPQRNFSTALQYLVNKYQINESKVNKLLADWQENEFVMKHLVSKVNRDHAKEPAQWKLNDVLQEEGEYTLYTMEGKRFANRTQLDSKVPEIWAEGKALSLAFGLIYRACAQSIQGSSRPEIITTTTLSDNKITIRIKAPEAISLRNEMLHLLDHHDLPPEDPESMEIGMAVIQSFFKIFNARMDVIDGMGKGAEILVSIPVIAALRTTILKDDEDEKPVRDSSDVII